MGQGLSRRFSLLKTPLVRSNIIRPNVSEGTRQDSVNVEALPLADGNLFSGSGRMRFCRAVRASLKCLPVFIVRFS